MFAKGLLEIFFSKLVHTECFSSRLQESISTKNRQLILYISDSEGLVDGFVGDLTFAERLY